MSYPPLTNVVRAWACLMPCERAICALFAAQEYNVGYVLVSSVNVIISQLSDFNTDKRRLAFEAIYNVTPVPKLIGRFVRTVYMADQLWMYDLQQCQSAGECGGFVDFCEQLDFVNQP